MIGAFPSAMPPPDRLGRRIAGVDALSSASHFCSSVKHLVPHRSFSPESGISLLRSTIRISQIQLCGTAATCGIHHLSSVAVRADDLYQRLEVSRTMVKNFRVNGQLVRRPSMATFDSFRQGPIRYDQPLSPWPIHRPNSLCRTSGQNSFMTLKAVSTAICWPHLFIVFPRLRSVAG